MFEITDNTFGERAGFVNQYLDEYRLLDRVSRVSHKKLRRSFNERKLNQVLKWIRDGRGQGRHEEYSPWIRITRGFSSPVSHQVFASLTVHRRNHHFLSKLEHHTALQLAYLGAVELRECLPMWPTEHQHPIDERTNARTTGLLDIARDAGIEHGNFVGSDVPYIASLDIMATVLWRGQTHHIGVSCKPDEIHTRSPRAQERATLDEIYCSAVGARHLREGGGSFSAIITKNLQTYRPTKKEIQRWAGSTQLEDFCEHLNQPSDGKPLHLCISHAGLAVGASEEAATLWRVGAWLRLIDVDMGKRISMLQPIQLGGSRCANKLAEHFLGVSA